MGISQIPVKNWILHEGIITCFHTFHRIFDDTMNVHSLPKEMIEKNKVLYILINSYVTGHWKNILARKEIQNKGYQALKQIIRTCMTLSQWVKNKV